MSVYQSSTTGFPTMIFGEYTVSKHDMRPAGQRFAVQHTPSGATAFYRFHSDAVMAARELSKVPS